MLIKPSRIGNIKYSAIILAYTILNILKANGNKITYLNLYNEIKKRDEKMTIIFRNGLNFLYIIGKIEYRYDTDIIEIV